jgi:MoxR-like ATPase
VKQEQVSEAVLEARAALDAVFGEVAKQIVGQRGMVRAMVMALLARGHVLLEGVPGLAKTRAVKTLAGVLDLGFRRIQFTPDLLPSDLTGNLVYVANTGEFRPRMGPIFSNIILADEINRAPAKVQSALLEAMEERQVTIGEQTYPLEEPFFVLATQNPIEQEGTYPLPEAQLDRFLLKVLLDYPSHDEELRIVRLVSNDDELSVRKVLNAAGVDRLRSVARRVAVDQRIEEYIVNLVGLSRSRDRERTEHARFVEYGASPRASVYLHRCARINAMFEGREYVIPEDVKEVALPVLRHRIVLSYEADSENVAADQVVRSILNQVKVP